MKTNIIKILNKRANYFELIHHSFEANELRSAINIIERLIPPELFTKNDEEQDEGLSCVDCKYYKSKKYHDVMYCRDCRQKDRFTAKALKNGIH